MGLFGAILGKVAGKAIGAGAEIAKQKIADKKAANEARNEEIQSMIGKKIKLCNYNITKWWNSNGEMITTVDRQMKDRNWKIQNVNNNRYCLLHAPSQTTIWVSVNEII